MIERAPARVVPIATGSMITASAARPTGTEGTADTVLIGLRDAATLHDIANSALSVGLVLTDEQAATIGALRHALGFGPDHPDPFGDQLAALGLDSSCPFSRPTADMGAQSKRMVTVREAAESVGVSARHIRRLPVARDPITGLIDLDCEALVKIRDKQEASR
jgi:hypothetical protein